MATERPFVVNPVLTAVAIGWRNPDLAFVADQVLPRIDVGAEQFKWLEYPIDEAFTAPDNFVGRRGAVPKVEFTAQERDGSVKAFALEDSLPLDDVRSARAMRDKGVSIYDPEKRATQMLAELSDVLREQRVARAVVDPANYAAASVTNIAVAGERFDDPDSDPDSVISAALQSVMIYRPNRCVMGEGVWDKLRKHQKLVQAVKGHTTGAGKITREEFVSYFELSMLSIGKGWMNTAAKGQPANKQRIWGKDIAFHWINAAVGPEGGVTWGFSPTFGSKFTGTFDDVHGGGIEGARVIRVGERISELVVAKAAGALIQNAIS